jgi:hypothetical protein
MTTVRQLLDQKGGNTWSIHPDATPLLQSLFAGE